MSIETVVKIKEKATKRKGRGFDEGKLKPETFRFDLNFDFLDLETVNRGNYGQYESVESEGNEPGPQKCNEIFFEFIVNHIILLIFFQLSKVGFYS